MANLIKWRETPQKTHEAWVSGKKCIITTANSKGHLTNLSRIGRTKARELAAILTHFADTGELPGEVGDGQ